MIETDLAQATLEAGDIARRRVRLANGLNLACVESGAPDGPPVLLLHGYSDSSHSFALLRPHLPDVRAISVDMRGHGQSDKPAGDYAPAPLAEDIRMLLDALGIGAAMVVGHSLGSLVAQHFAAAHPARVSGLVLIGSTVLPPIRRGDAVWHEIAAFTEPPGLDSAFLAQFQSNPGPVDPGFVATAIAESTKLPLHVWHGVLDAITDRGTAGIAAAVRAPTLILWGDQDAFFGAEHQAALRAAIGGTTFEIFEGIGHNPHWERPRDVARLIAGFIASLPTETASPASRPDQKTARPTTLPAGA